VRVGLWLAQAVLVGITISKSHHQIVFQKVKQQTLFFFFMCDSKKHIRKKGSIIANERTKSSWLGHVDLWPCGLQLGLASLTWAQLGHLLAS
jgi:hypothetical protein